MHFNRAPINERADVALNVDVTALRPAHRVPVLQQLGIWRVPRTMHDVPALASWTPAATATADGALNPSGASTTLTTHNPTRDLCSQRLYFLGVNWVFALEAKRVQWTHLKPTSAANANASAGAGAAPKGGVVNDPIEGFDAELCAVLRRPANTQPAVQPGAPASGAISLVALVEFGDRWSTWLRCVPPPPPTLAPELSRRIAVHPSHPLFHARLIPCSL